MAALRSCSQGKRRIPILSAAGSIRTVSAIGYALGTLESEFVRMMRTSMGAAGYLHGFSTVRQVAVRCCWQRGTRFVSSFARTTLPQASAHRRVAVLGGSFDPVTNGHLTSAAEVLHAKFADEVWLVPCGMRLDKPSLKTPYLQRLLMCHNAVESTFTHCFPMKVSDVEMDEPHALTTHDLMRKLEARYPHVDFSFVIGSDLYDTIDTWEDSPERKDYLINRCHWLVCDRPGYTLAETLKPNFQHMKPRDGMTVVSQELSSSEIRRRISFGVEETGCLAENSSMLINGLLPTTTLAQIRRYGLYSNTVPNPKGNRIAIVGGSFDPITNGHLSTMAEVLHANLADEVWIVPCGPRPDKPSLKTSYIHRLNLCHLCVNTSFLSNFPVRVCDFELGATSALTTHDLMRKLDKEFPEMKFTFLIGSDLYEQKKNWEQGERKHYLLNSCKWLVFERPGYELPEALPSNFEIMRPHEGFTVTRPALSSTEIRRRINFGDLEREYLQSANWGSINGLMPRAGVSYIKRYGLYRNC